MERAAKRLVSAGRRALGRGDDRASAALLERSLELTRPLRLDVHLELDLSQALENDPLRAATLAERTAKRAAAAGDAAGEALARLVAARHRVEFAPEPTIDELDALAHAALPLLEEASDHAGLVHVWNAASEVANHRGFWEQRGRSLEEALRHAQLAGLQPTGHAGVASGYLLGPEPTDELLARFDRLLTESSHPVVLLNRARVLAMLERQSEAWTLALQAHERLREISADDGGEHHLANVAVLAGDHETAARYLRILCERLEAHDQRNILSTYLPMLGRSLYMLGRLDEAKALAQRGRALGDEQDATTQALWRQVQALVLARRGHHAEAETLARAAITIIDQSDGLNYQGEALCDLSEVLAAAGRTDEAAAALTQARERYERKRNLAMVRQVQERLAKLQPVAS
jgi:tetratricopeptide (TPR) repeat protein